jgi:predicted NAD/FAD-dependent oxidoreductase
MNSNLTVLLMTNRTNNKASSYFTNDQTLGWVSYENSKRRFKYNKDLWVLQSTFKYGDKHTDNYRNKRKYYTNILINKFKKLTGIKFKKIYFTRIHGWKYSSNSKAINVKSYWDKKCGLGICADWFGGPRLENGWLSANDLYAKIIKR